MFAMFAGMNTIPPRAILITGLLPEPHLSLYQTIGLVRCAVWTHQISQKRRMKKGILVFLSFIFLISIYAQENYFKPTQPEGTKRGKSNFHGGIKAGFTGSQITEDGFSFQGFNKFGGYVGVFANLPVSKNGKWLIQPELNFIMKGCKHTVKFDENGGFIGPNREEYWLQLMYGQIPIIVKWRFFKGFELEAGPAFGILFKNTGVEKVDGELNVGAPPFVRFEFSGIIGLGYLFYNHIGVNLRFEGSFLPVRKYRAHHYFLTGGQHNQTFAFCIYNQF
jgi:hypothetical protein